MRAWSFKLPAINVEIDYGRLRLVVLVTAAILSLIDLAFSAHLLVSFKHRSFHEPLSVQAYSIAVAALTFITSTTCLGLRFAFPETYGVQVWIELLWSSALAFFTLVSSAVNNSTGFQNNCKKTESLCQLYQAFRGISVILYLVLFGYFILICALFARDKRHNFNERPLFREIGALFTDSTKEAKIGKVGLSRMGTRRHRMIVGGVLAIFTAIEMALSIIIGSKISFVALSICVWTFVAILFDVVLFEDTYMAYFTGELANASVLVALWALVAFFQTASATDICSVTGDCPKFIAQAIFSWFALVTVSACLVLALVARLRRPERGLPAVQP